MSTTHATGKAASSPPDQLTLKEPHPSENAVRGYKLAAKISGCWRTLATLQRHCRIRSYFTTARSHGRHPLAAIRDALTGNAWMPPHPA